MFVLAINKQFPYFNKHEQPYCLIIAEELLLKQR